MIKTIFAMLAAVSLTELLHLLIQLMKNTSSVPMLKGCMLLRECTDHVQELKTVSDLNKHEELADIDYSIVADEFNSLVRSLNKVGG